MKTKTIIKSLMTLLVTAALGVCVASAKDKEASQADLQARAKITKAEAEKTALGKVPGGTVKDAELEEEDGNLIWSIEITTTGSKNITEVNVNAVTGKIVNVETETPGGKEKED